MARWLCGVQVGETKNPRLPKEDPTITYGTVPDVPYCASYNAELFKYLNPQSSMYAALKKMFPLRQQPSVDPVDQPGGPLKHESR